jgi:hypothetical protein
VLKFVSYKHFLTVALIYLMKEIKNACKIILFAFLATLTLYVKYRLTEQYHQHSHGQSSLSRTLKTDTTFRKLPVSILT